MLASLLVLLASGTGFADALAGSAAAAGAHLPLLLTSPDRLSTQVLSTLQALGVSRVMVLGGTGAISAAAAKQLTHDRSWAGYGCDGERGQYVDRLVMEQPHWHVLDGGDDPACARCDPARDGGPRDSGHRCRQAGDLVHEYGADLRNRVLLRVVRS